jgi:hypothetical protein
VSAAFHDLPADAYPLTMRAYGAESGALLWEERVAAPAAVYVPPLARIHGEHVRVVVEYANGERHET